MDAYEVLEAEYHSGEPCDCYPPSDGRPVIECVAWARNIVKALDQAGFSIWRQKNLCTLCGRGTEQPTICLVCQTLARQLPSLPATPPVQPADAPPASGEEKSKRRTLADDVAAGFYDHPAP